MGWSGFLPGFLPTQVGKPSRTAPGHSYGSRPEPSRITPGISLVSPGPPRATAMEAVPGHPGQLPGSPGFLPDRPGPQLGTSSRIFPGFHSHRISYPLGPGPRNRMGTTHPLRPRGRWPLARCFREADDYHALACRF